MRLVYDEASKGHTYTNSWPGQYLTHAHSHITRAVARPRTAVLPLLGLISMA